MIDAERWKRAAPCVAVIFEIGIRRLEEFASQQKCTSTLRVLRDFSVVGIQLDKMVDYLTVMHSAGSRQQRELPHELAPPSRS